MTREDYEELVRLHGLGLKEVLKVEKLRPTCFDLIPMGTMSFMKNGDRLNIATAIADYEREHKEDI